MADHVFTEGEKKCLEQYWKECSKTPRKNLIKLVRHINMFNPFPMLVNKKVPRKNRNKTKN